MRTTAGDTTTAHANIKPIELQLRETGQKAYAQFQTRPTNHPLYPAIQRTAKRSVLRHKTAIHLLAESSNTNQTPMETIAATRTHPGEANPHTFYITSEKDKSIEWDKDNFNDGTMIYTDGSCYRKMVGASAVLYKGGIEIDLLRYQLGTEHNHTVFKGELIGIILSMHLVRMHSKTGTNTNFSINNKASIKAMQNT
jgi:hypothetical protein